MNLKDYVLERMEGFLNKSKSEMSLDQYVELINELKLLMHEKSPFSSEPVDCVLWVKNESVHANDYNPNSVAPPEMELLRLSISNDGYTQPIVTMVDGEDIRS